MSLRTEKVASTVRTILAQNIESDQVFSDTLITITDVELSPDIKQAKVWVSIYGKNAAKAKTKLINSKKHLQNLLSSNLKTKFTPRIDFYFDRSGKYVDKINKIIDNLTS